MVVKQDTIVAIATPPGKGGIGIVRISGPAVTDIIREIIKKPLKPRYAHFCTFFAEDSTPIDGGLSLYFSAPNSYTGEDMLEIHAHGSRIVLEQLTDRVVNLGARLARPGEFSERAFLNGKMDLVQAESVADLIDSASRQAANSALQSLQGVFSGRINGLKEEIIQIRASIESGLDFPDEEDVMDTTRKELKIKISDCLNDIDHILLHARQGAILNRGITATIVGQPNVGKSTFLNQLAGHNAAIVSEEPGTTRDRIEVNIPVDGIPVRVVDTAGLRTTNSAVEKEGIRRALEAASQSDILILIIEQDKQTEAIEQNLLEQLGTDTRVILVRNKIDLANKIPEIRTENNRFAEIYLSAKTGKGMDLFRNHLMEILGFKELHEDIFMARERHLKILERTRSLLSDCEIKNTENYPPEILAEDLRLAQQSLGEITGEVVPDDILAEIFSRFCIGK